MIMEVSGEKEEVKKERGREKKGRRKVIETGGQANGREDLRARVCGGKESFWGLGISSLILESFRD